MKTFLNAEHRTLKNVKQEVFDYSEEANQHCFCQLIHDGTALLNKEKYQAFVMQFTDNKF